VIAPRYDVRRLHDRDPGGEECPVAPESLAADGVGRHDTRLGEEDRRREAGRLDLDRPGDLGVARLTQRDELFGAETVEVHLLPPGLCHGAHDDLASGDLRELAPAERNHLVEDGTPYGRPSCDPKDRKATGLEIPRTCN
jgi:hypothetical protein